MTTSTQWRESVLAFSHLKGVGRVRLRRLMESATEETVGGAFEDAYSTFARQLKFPEHSPQELADARSHGVRLSDRCLSESIGVLLWGQEPYPQRLKRLDDPPAILFIKGSVLDGKSVAVIGTRQASSWGLHTAKSCATTLASAGVAVVSGLALGIDSAAHQGALRGEGPTWAVLPGGHDNIAPTSNRPLAERILERGGTLVSEYAPATQPNRPYFVERDRIQAGLSAAVLVIETGPTGGSMNTVRFAREARIPIFVTFPDERKSAAESDPTSLPEAQAGTWCLLKEGATQFRAIGDLDGAFERQDAETRANKELDRNPPGQRPLL